MLNRALLEEVLDVHWVADNVEVAPDFATASVELKSGNLRLENVEAPWKRQSAADSS
jgi:hypothetical protein